MESVVCGGSSDEVAGGDEASESVGLEVACAAYVGGESVDASFGVVLGLVVLLLLSGSVEYFAPSHFKALVCCDYVVEVEGCEGALVFLVAGGVGHELVEGAALAVAVCKHSDGYVDGLWGDVVTRWGEGGEAVDGGADEAAWELAVVVDGGYLVEGGAGSEGEGFGDAVGEAFPVGWGKPGVYAGTGGELGAESGQVVSGRWVCRSGVGRLRGLRRGGCVGVFHFSS